MLSDIEIAENCIMKPIVEIAGKLGLDDSQIECYGRYKAKVDYQNIRTDRNGRLILVTAINPTPAGEGKTTVSIGLADALSLMGKNVALALREPSLGPVFGMKGGAAGGGYSQVVPMDDINLHFTGDFHAIESANNLIAALLDNSIHQGNPLGIDPRTITWKRCMDMNDRQLRNILTGLGGKSNGTPREDGFDITTASEVMALFCLTEDITDLKLRLGNVTLARTYDGKPVKLTDIGGEGAVATLLKDAIKPNLVQTLEGTPAFVHGGPFANIAHGCNSIIATETALKLADYVVTEAGFGADLGAEKFIDIKARVLKRMPDAIVVVATVKALKSHGGVKKEELGLENLEALEKGIANLKRHIENIRNVWNIPAVVAVNRFYTDTEAEEQMLISRMEEIGVPVTLAEAFEKGGEGDFELAGKVLEVLDNAEVNAGRYTYPDEIPLKEKIEAVAKRIYHADGVDFAPGVITKMKKAEEEGAKTWPVCIAKTQYSFSDKQKLVGAPTGFRITIRDIKVSSGAGFVVAYAGDILTMPGLPKVPAAMNIDIDERGRVTGLF